MCDAVCSFCRNDKRNMPNVGGQKTQSTIDGEKFQFTSFPDRKRKQKNYLVKETF